MRFILRSAVGLFTVVSMFGLFLSVGRLFPGALDARERLALGMVATLGGGATMLACAALGEMLLDALFRARR